MDDTNDLPLAPFNLTDIPTLEKYIPLDHLPHTLIIHDPDSVTVLYDEYKRTGITRTYLLQHETKPETMTTAHLYLSANEVIGSGTHAIVYRALLFLPPESSSLSTTTTNNNNNRLVQVAAKVASSSFELVHLLLENDIYRKLPIDFQRKADNELDPVVPNFYGYYKPDENAEWELPFAGATGILKARMKWFWSRTESPILLSEICGTQVKPPELDKNIL